ncbi:Hypothetical protein R9X50_00661500 [Acrodontium crateriforme]|uniref:F-box domain-containing protein n=1 Tax=Acrodontium crateriforme TaxID=150365 RepID=A0AAQ3M865_9PEZI|nr:Hypothetical protein R9X50_00661500 [Acrodontium crateriforme]
MGLLKHLRSRSRLKDSPQSPPQYSYYSPNGSIDHVSRLPSKVLDNIFTYVCPHVQDQSYESSERSQIGDGCMLCDLRDLANCARVCRRWYTSAQQKLYSSVRIDAVHYCELEEELAEKRRKSGKHFRSKSAPLEAGEIPNVRLALLCRTVRERPNLASQVLILKLPYMTRETAKGDLARTVSALPNLRYVDLPDGFFTGDPSCLPLRQELQSRCPDIRKMSYMAGSEETFELLAHRYWTSIQILELDSLAIEPMTLRIVLASLPTLHELTLSNLPWLDDGIFQSSMQLPEFPPLQVLKLDNTPNVTSQGLTTYLKAPQNREMLFSLYLKRTGVTVQDLHSVLWAASQLQHLAIEENVSKSLGLSIDQLQPLSSISLRTMNFEITSSDEVHGLQKPAESYYHYLASSLHQNALPALATLYVREQSFPELLLLHSNAPPFGNSSPPGSMRSPNNLSSNMSNLSINSPQSPLSKQAFNAGPGFKQELEVFSKGIDEFEWVFTSIAPPQSRGAERRGSLASGGRPLSAYSASRGLGPQWAQGGFGGEARKSVIVGNGFGGFLAVPQDAVPRPMTSEGPQRGAFGGNGSDASASPASRLSFLKPPPSINNSLHSGENKRASRQDLWR